MAQKEFSSSSNKWVQQEQQFLFSRKTTKTKCNIHEETQKKKKEFFMVFFIFMGCSLNWVFCEIHELMSFISCNNRSCWRWRCCYCSKIIAAIFSWRRRWEGAKLSNKFDDQKTQAMLCCSIIIIMTTSVLYYYYYYYFLLNL